MLANNAAPRVIPSEGVSSGLSSKATNFINLLEGHSLYEARLALEQDPSLKDLSHHPQVQTAAVSAVIRSLRSGDRLDPPRFAIEFGVEREQLIAAGAPQLALQAACRPGDMSVACELLSAFRPQPEGALDTEFFEAFGPILCKGLLCGDGFTATETLKLLHFPKETSAYRNWFPESVRTVIDFAEITDMQTLIGMLTGSSGASQWTRLFMDLSKQPGIEIPLERNDLALPLSPFQVSTLRLLGVSPQDFCRPSPNIRQAPSSWQPTSDEALDRTGQNSPAPSNASSGFARFIDTKHDEVTNRLIAHIFGANDFHFPPSLFAGELSLLARFTAADWALLKNSPEPLISLKGLCNHYSKEPDPHLDQMEVERLRSLPLHHGTSFEAGVSVAEQGALFSHREALRRGLITRSGGNTMSDDQLMGLDTHVFLELGRPSYLQAERHDVNIVVSKEALSTPGAFVTPHDHADYVAAAGSSVAEVWQAEGQSDSTEISRIRRRQALEYLADISVAPYCYEALARTFADHHVLVEAFAQGLGEKAINSISRGGREAMGFHSPEIKIPQVPLDLVEAFEFRSAEHLAQFITRFPHLSERCRLMPIARGRLLSVSGAESGALGKGALPQ